MSQTLDSDKVRHIARLARIALTDQEVDQLGQQLGQVIDYNAAELAKLDLDSVEPTNQTTGLTNVWRPDQVGPSLDQALALSQSSHAVDNQFEVAKVLGES